MEEEIFNSYLIKVKKKIAHKYLWNGVGIHFAHVFILMAASFRKLVKVAAPAHFTKIMIYRRH